MTTHSTYLNIAISQKWKVYYVDYSIRAHYIWPHHWYSVSVPQNRECYKTNQDMFMS